MAKSAAQLDREIAASLVAGDADLEQGSPSAIGKAIRKAAKVKGGALLGYTESGKAVHAPTRAGAPNTNDIVTFTKTKAKYLGWTKADHMDAAHFFDLASAAATDPVLSKTLRRWSSVHWDIGGRWTSPETEARFGVSSYNARRGLGQ